MLYKQYLIIVMLFSNQRVVSMYSPEKDECYLIGGIPDVLGTFESSVSSFTVWTHFIAHLHDYLYLYTPILDYRL